MFSIYLTFFSQEGDEEEESEVKTLRKEAELVDGDDGGEYIVEDEKDDEETIAEEEKLQKDVDYKSELDDLQKEGMSKQFIVCLDLLSLF